MNTKPYTACFRVYGELNDFLPPKQRQCSFGYCFDGHPGIKDPVEAIGVPHPEVALIVVNKRPVGFGYQLQDGDQVAVYPAFMSLDVSPSHRLRPEPHSAFVLDVHLGKLARMLRMLGFDVLYRNDLDDAEIVRISVDQRRTVLTRDRRLLFARAVSHGVWVRHTDPELQLREVLDRFELYSQINPFCRCIACNGLLKQVDKTDVLNRLEPLTKQYVDRFFQCPDCHKVYWHGSHVERMGQLLNRVRSWASPVSD